MCLNYQASAEERREKCDNGSIDSEEENTDNDEDDGGIEFYDKNDEDIDIKEISEDYINAYNNFKNEDK